MRKKLEVMADRIETVLSLHNVPVRVTGGTVTPRWCRFQVLPALGTKISEIKGLSEELATALDAPNCRVSRRGVAVAVEVPRDDPQPVRLLPIYEQLTNPANDKPYPPATAVLGMAEDGAPLLVRLPSPDVGHILVVGNEGAGKTTLLQTMVLSLAMGNKPDDLAFVFYGDGLPEVAKSISNLGFSVHRIESWSLAVGKRTVHIADEVIGHDSPSSVDAFARRMNITARHHFIMALDGIPSKKLVDLFKVRLVGRVTDSSDARTATGWSGTGAERLTGRGDFVAVAEGKVIRFQAAHVSSEEVREIACH